MRGLPLEAGKEIGTYSRNGLFKQGTWSNMAKEITIRELEQEHLLADKRFGLLMPFNCTQCGKERSFS
jgi:hypothetical protein